MNNLMELKKQADDAKKRFNDAKEDAFAALFDHGMTVGHPYLAQEIERLFGIPARTFVAKVVRSNGNYALRGRLRIRGYRADGRYYTVLMDCNPRWVTQEFVATDGSGRKVNLRRKITEYTLVERPQFERVDIYPNPQYDPPIRPNY